MARGESSGTLPGENSRVRAWEKSAEAVVVKTPAERREERRAEASNHELNGKPFIEARDSWNAQSGNYGSFCGKARWGRTGAAGAGHVGRGRVETDEPK